VRPEAEETNLIIEIVFSVRWELRMKEELPKNH
jgi:hypothetical protein